MPSDPGLPSGPSMADGFGVGDAEASTSRTWRLPPAFVQPTTRPPTKSTDDVLYSQRSSPRYSGTPWTAATSSAEEPTAKVPLAFFPAFGIASFSLPPAFDQPFTLPPWKVR